MFELNPSPDIQVEIIDDCKVYTIDNFYQDPDSVYEYIMSHDAELWKMDEEPTHNNIFFEDKKIKITRKGRRVKDAVFFGAHLGDSAASGREGLTALGRHSGDSEKLLRVSL